MSELEAFAAHCRAMAAWTDPRNQSASRSAWCLDGHPGINLPDHDKCTGLIGSLARFAPTPRLCGCDCHPRNPGPTTPERRLWAALADEVDAYLAGDEGDDETLFDDLGDA